MTTIEEARAVLAGVEAHAARPLTKLLHRFLALTSVRPGEARQARWEEFEDLLGEAPLWRIPKDRMKMKREHLVPLTPQAVAVIQAAHPFSGRTDFVSPGSRHRRVSISEASLSTLLLRAGYGGKHVPHGWRASFSTIMNERYPQDRAVIDLMLAHSPKDRIEAAYNRSALLPRRRELAAIWADLLLDKARPLEALLSHGEIQDEG